MAFLVGRYSDTAVRTPMAAASSSISDDNFNTLDDIKTSSCRSIGPFEVSASVGTHGSTAFAFTLGSTGSGYVADTKSILATGNNPVPAIAARTYASAPSAGTCNWYKGFFPKRFTKQVEKALESLPNQIIDDVEVTMGTWSRNELSFTVTFMGSGVSGTQNILEIEDFSCGDGCTPKRDGLYLKTWNFNSGDFDQERTSTTETFLSTVMEETAADYNNYECGRRGKCDYDTGKCECFEGYAGLSCSTQQALV